MTPYCGCDFVRTELVLRTGIKVAVYWHNPVLSALALTLVHPSTMINKVLTEERLQQHGQQTKKLEEKKNTLYK